LEVLVSRIQIELTALGAGSAGDLETLETQCRDWGRRLAPHLADTARLLHRWIGAGKSVLFEGAQGALLDVDHGTFPYVTSSSSTAGGAATGTGVAPTALDGAVGVLKAYTTRVGGGPFPTELDDETGELLRTRGNEFGTTTGRPRRCGWLDLVAARYAQRLNGVGAVALTKLDVLDELDEIRLATHYRIRGELVEDFPADREAFAQAEPVYTTVPGWRQSTVGILEEARLPTAARAYIERIEEHVGAPVALISTGPRREETILRDLPVTRRYLGEGLELVLAQRGQP
jgi:adenylosuccinate synthase